MSTSTPPPASRWRVLPVDADSKSLAVARIISWIVACVLVATQVAAVLASSPTAWFKWLCISVALFGGLVLVRFAASRPGSNAAHELASYELASYELAPYELASYELPGHELAEHELPGPALQLGTEIATPKSERAWSWFTLAAMTIVLLAGLVKTPHRSDDLYAYGAYGRIATEHSASPYTARPSAFPDDPVIERMAKGWRNTRSVYGPAFTAVSALGMQMAGTSALIERLWFQSLAAASTLFSALLLRRLSPRHWWLFALNPVSLIVVSHEGHNDALVGLGILSALWFVKKAAANAELSSQFVNAAIGSLMFAASIKITAVLAVPGIALWIIRAVGWKRAMRTGAPWMVVCGGLFVATGGPAAFEAFRSMRTFRSTTSLWHLDWIRNLTDNTDAKPGVLALTIPITAVVAAGLLIIWKARGARGARPSGQSWQASHPGYLGCTQSHSHLHTYGFECLVAVTVLPLIVFITLGLYVLPWYWGWLLAPAVLLPGKLRNMVLISAAMHTLAYGAGTLLHENFATVLTIARLISPLAFAVVLVSAVVVVARSQLQSTAG